MFFNKNKIYPFDTYVVFERCTNTKLIFVLILMKEKKIVRVVISKSKLSVMHFGASIWKNYINNIVLDNLYICYYFFISQ